MVEAVFFDVGVDAHPAVPVGGGDVRARSGRARACADRARLRARTCPPWTPTTRRSTCATGTSGARTRGRRPSGWTSTATCATWRASATTRRAWRPTVQRGLPPRIEAGRCTPDVAGCLRALKERGLRAGGGVELGRRARGPAARPQAAAVLRHGGVFGGAWATASRTRSSSTWLASRWACAPSRRGACGRPPRCGRGQGRKGAGHPARHRRPARRGGRTAPYERVVTLDRRAEAALRRKGQRPRLFVAADGHFHAGHVPPPTSGVLCWGRSSSAPRPTGACATGSQRSADGVRLGAEGRGVLRLLEVGRAGARSLPPSGPGGPCCRAPGRGSRWLLVEGLAVVVGHEQRATAGTPAGVFSRMFESE